jgi:hypothetical protein
VQRVQGWPRVWLALVAVGPLLLAVGRLLPAEGAGLALRLAGAAACVLLLPGACLVRALGDRGSLGLQLAAALVWSLVGIFLALAAAFAAGAPFGLVLALVGSMSFVAFAFSLRRPIPRPERSELLAVLVLGVLGAGLAGALWWATETIGGSLGASLSDALFHLGRIRKLDEAGSLGSVHVLNELQGGDVHPGYAFPLWHAALALVARIAGVDATLVVLYLPAILTPLAILLAYAAGRALFRSRAGGIATALGWLALAAFPFGGVGALQYLAQPGGASRFLLLPALLALVFAFVDRSRVAHLAGAAAASFCLAVVHPTYVIFAAVLLAGFLLARAILTRGDEVRRIGAGLAAAMVPGALYFAWLAQFVDQTRVRPPVRFTQQVEGIGSAIRLSADQLAWGGGTKVVALATVPLALLAGGRRWAAYVLGGTAALGLVALVPQLFDPFTDAISLSQAVRVGSFLPLPFALAGAAVVAGRLGLAGVGLAFAAGLAAELAFRAPATGAGWVMWVAAIASAGGLAVLALGRPRKVEERRAGRWAALSAAAFAAPAFVAGFASYERWDEPDPYGLTPGLTTALREHVEPLAVVLAPSATSYRVVGYAPARIVVGPPGHVFDSGPEYVARVEAVHDFFLEQAVDAEERATVLRRYRVSWVVLDTTRGRPALPEGLTRVYGDARYELYRVDGRQEPA